MYINSSCLYIYTQLRIYVHMLSIFTYLYIKKVQQFTESKTRQEHEKILKNFIIVCSIRRPLFALIDLQLFITYAVVVARTQCWVVT